MFYDYSYKCYDQGESSLAITKLWFLNKSDLLLSRKVYQSTMKLLSLGFNNCVSHQLGGPGFEFSIWHCVGLTHNGAVLIR